MAINPAYATRRPSSWADTAVAQAYTPANDFNKTLAFTVDDNGNVGVTNAAANSVASDVANDRVASAFYGGLKDWGQTAGVKTATLAAMANAMGLKNVDLSSLAIAGLNPVSAVAGLMGDTIGTGLGLSKPTSKIADAALTGFFGLMSKLAGPIGVLGSVVSPIAKTALADAFNLRNMEGVRDYGEDSKGWFQGMKDYADATDVANQAISRNESAYDSAMKALDDAKTPQERALAMQMVDRLGQISMAEINANPDLANMEAYRNLTIANPHTTEVENATLSGMLDGWAAMATPGVDPNTGAYTGYGMNSGAWGHPGALANALATQGINSFGNLTNAQIKDFAQDMTGYQTSMALVQESRARQMAEKVKEQQERNEISRQMQNMGTTDATDGDNSFGGVPAAVARARMATAYSEATNSDSSGSSGSFGGGAGTGPGGGIKGGSMHAGDASGMGAPGTGHGLA